ncbi:hypothetical protein OB934_21565 [Aeromonas salmonicida]|uniref:putative adhesin n=1 Tax=Aeromonas salmonicida TaxID=645 RepID=UPI00259F820D|nr:hypothetical protein [Aeromonas salmonicida]MDM5065362.1 hypothetical protein [Aeromonas salmonicida]
MTIIHQTGIHTAKTAHAGSATAVDACANMPSLSSVAPQVSQLFACVAHARINNYPWDKDTFINQILSDAINLEPKLGQWLSQQTSLSLTDLGNALPLASLHLSNDDAERLFSALDSCARTLIASDDAGQAISGHGADLLGSVELFNERVRSYRQDTTDGLRLSPENDAELQQFMNGTGKEILQQLCERWQQQNDMLQEFRQIGTNKEHVLVDLKFVEQTTKAMSVLAAKSGADTDLGKAAAALQNLTQALHPEKNQGSVPQDNGEQKRNTQAAILAFSSLSEALLSAQSALTQAASFSPQTQADKAAPLYHTANDANAHLKQALAAAGQTCKKLCANGNSNWMIAFRNVLNTQQPALEAACADIHHALKTAKKTLLDSPQLQHSLMTQATEVLKALGKVSVEHSPGLFVSMTGKPLEAQQALRTAGCALSEVCTLVQIALPAVQQAGSVSAQKAMNNVNGQIHELAEVWTCMEAALPKALKLLNQGGDKAAANILANHLQTLIGHGAKALASLVGRVGELQKAAPDGVLNARFHDIAHYIDANQKTLAGAVEALKTVKHSLRPKKSKAEVALKKAGEAGAYMSKNVADVGTGIKHLAVSTLMNAAAHYWSREHAIVAKFHPDSSQALHFANELKIEVRGMQDALESLRRTLSDLSGTASEKTAFGMAKTKAKLAKDEGRLGHSIHKQKTERRGEKLEALKQKYQLMQKALTHLLQESHAANQRLEELAARHPQHRDDIGRLRAQAENTLKLANATQATLDNALQHLETPTQAVQNAAVGQVLRELGALQTAVADGEKAAKQNNMTAAIETLDGAVDALSGAIASLKKTLPDREEFLSAFGRLTQALNDKSLKVPKSEVTTAVSVALEKVATIAQETRPWSSERHSPGQDAGIVPDGDRFTQFTRTAKQAGMTITRQLNNLQYDFALVTGQRADPTSVDARIIKHLAVFLKSQCDEMPGAATVYSQLIDTIADDIAGEFTKARDPKGHYFAAQLKEEFRRACEDTLLMPQSLENVKAKYSPVEEYILKGGAKNFQGQLLYSALSGSVNRILDTALPIVSPLRIGVKIACLAKTMIAASLEMKATQMPGRPLPDGELRGLLWQEIEKTAISTLIASLPAIGKAGIRAGLTAGAIYQEGAANVAADQGKSPVINSLFSAMSAGTNTYNSSLKNSRVPHTEQQLRRDDDFDRTTRIKRNTRLQKSQEEDIEYIQIPKEKDSHEAVAAAREKFAEAEAAVEKAKKLEAAVEKAKITRELPKFIIAVEVVAEELAEDAEKIAKIAKEAAKIAKEAKEAAVETEVETTVAAYTEKTEKLAAELAIIAKAAKARAAMAPALEKIVEEKAAKARAAIARVKAADVDASAAELTSAVYFSSGGDSHVMKNLVDSGDLPASSLTVWVDIQTTQQNLTSDLVKRRSFTDVQTAIDWHINERSYQISESQPDSDKQSIRNSIIWLENQRQIYQNLSAGFDTAISALRAREETFSLEPVVRMQESLVAAYRMHYPTQSQGLSDKALYQDAVNVLTNTADPGAAQRLANSHRLVFTLAEHKVAWTKNDTDITGVDYFYHSVNGPLSLDTIQATFSRALETPALPYSGLTELKPIWQFWDQTDMAFYQHIENYKTHHARNEATDDIFLLTQHTNIYPEDLYHPPVASKTFHIEVPVEEIRLSEPGKTITGDFNHYNTEKGSVTLFQTRSGDYWAFSTVSNNKSLVSIDKATFDRYAGAAEINSEADVKTFFSKTGVEASLLPEPKTTSAGSKAVDTADSILFAPYNLGRLLSGRDSRRVLPTVDVERRYHKVAASTASFDTSKSLNARMIDEATTSNQAAADDKKNFRSLDRRTKPAKWDQMSLTDKFLFGTSITWGNIKDVNLALFAPLKVYVRSLEDAGYTPSEEDKAEAYLDLGIAVATLGAGAVVKGAQATKAALDLVKEARKLGLTGSSFKQFMFNGMKPFLKSASTGIVTAPLREVFPLYDVGDMALSMGSKAKKLDPSFVPDSLASDTAANAVRYRGNKTKVPTPGQQAAAVPVSLASDTAESAVQTTSRVIDNLDKKINGSALLDAVTKNDHSITDAITNPAGKCESIMLPVGKFMKGNGFDDIKYRGMLIWENGTKDTIPSNHFVVTGKKNGQVYVFDLTAHQFADKGMSDLNGPLILSDQDWAAKYQGATTRKRITYTDYDSPSTATGNYRPLPGHDPLIAKEGEQALTTPKWFNTLRNWADPDINKGLYSLTSVPSKMESTSYTAYTARQYRDFQLLMPDDKNVMPNKLLISSHGYSTGEIVHVPEKTKVYFYTRYGEALEDRGLTSHKNTPLVRVSHLSTDVPDAKGGWRAATKNEMKELTGTTQPGQYKNMKLSHFENENPSGAMDLWRLEDKQLSAAASAKRRPGIVTIDPKLKKSPHLSKISDTISPPSAEIELHVLACRNTRWGSWMNNTPGTRATPVLPNHLSNVFSKNMGRNYSSSRPPTDVIGNVIIHAAQNLSPNTKAGVIMTGMGALGAAAAYAGLTQEDPSALYAKALDATIRSADSFKGNFTITLPHDKDEVEVESVDLEAIQKHFFGKDNTMTDQKLTEIVDWLKKVRRNANKEELILFYNGHITQRLRETCPVPSTLDRVSPQQIDLFFMFLDTRNKAPEQFTTEYHQMVCNNFKAGLAGGPVLTPITVANGQTGLNIVDQYGLNILDVYEDNPLFQSHQLNIPLPEGSEIKIRLPQRQPT